MAPKSHFPPFSLAQIFVLIWLVAIWCAAWFHPSGAVRPIFQKPDANWSVELGEPEDGFPRVAIADEKQVRAIDYTSGEILFSKTLPPLRGPSLRSEWWTWPDVVNTFGYRYNFAAGTSDIYHPVLFDGRSFGLRGSDFTDKYHAAYIFDIETGRTAQWRGEKTSSNGGTSSRSAGNFRLALGEGVAGPSSESSSESTGNISLDLANGGTLWLEFPKPKSSSTSQPLSDSTSSDYITAWPASISYGFVARADFGDVEPNSFGLGTQRDRLIAYSSSLIYAPECLAIYASPSEERQPYTWPFERLELFDLAKRDVTLGNEIIGNRYRSFPDRLGIEAESVVWNLKAGRLATLPPITKDIRMGSDRAFVHAVDNSLYWLDLDSGKRTYLIGPTSQDWLRPLHFLLWLVAWYFVSRPKREGDYTRRLGYVLFATTILALMPPSLDRFHIGHMNLDQHWLFALACLVCLAIATAIAVLRKAASISVLVTALLAFGFLGYSWILWSGEVRFAQKEPLVFQAIKSLKEDFSSNEIDFLRPWRFGASKPSEQSSIRVRDHAGFSTDN
jgi:hypothetical protein